jgi:hypothetical protein
MTGSGTSPALRPQRLRRSTAPSSVDLFRRRALHPAPGGGLIHDMHDHHLPSRRAAIYAREAPGRRGRLRLEQRVGRLAGEATRMGACHVATYAECSLTRPWVRPGLCRLLADAPWAFDLVVVDSYAQLAADRAELRALLGQLASAGVQAAAAQPSAGRRAARLVGNLVLADLVGEALR